MNKIFREEPVQSLKENVFNLIGEEWMLITAGKKGHFNTMTASWGTMGVLWNLPVAICFVRPQRYTFSFMEEYGNFTLCFLEQKYNKILQFCGTHSGRNTDKAGKTGLVPLETPDGNIFFEQARIVLECRKIYSDRLKEGSFLLRELAARNYPSQDFHSFYIGEVIRCLVG